MTKKVAIFDFDGTIYRKDSIIETCKYFYKRHPSKFSYIFYQLLLISLFKLHLISTFRFKEKFCFYLKYLSKEDLNQFWTQEYPSNFNSQLLARIHELKNNSTELVCISASVDYIIKDFLMQQLGFDKVIANRMDSSVKIKFTDARNCRGIEKINRFNLEYQNQTIQIIEAYSDNNDDKELLSLAEKPFKVFKNNVQTLVL